MGLNKNSPEAGTCFGKNYKTFYEGFNYQTKDTFFFAFIIQFLLLLMIYWHVGHGKYWRILFYSSCAGIIGAIIEHSTIAFICQNSQKNNHTIVIPFFIEEFCWIICEYAIPILNLIKMTTLSKSKATHVIKYVIYGLSIPFSIVRLLDGYDGMMKGYLSTDLSKTCHGIAFGTMAIADVICTSGIIYALNDKKLIGGENGGISAYLKNSSYTILIIVDIVSLLLSILYIVSTLIPDNTAFSASTTLFHCLKSVFILVLATDALIFRYGFSNSTTFHETNNSEAIHSTEMISSMNYKTSLFKHDANCMSIGITKKSYRGSDDSIPYIIGSSKI
ncbi:hypothetical protein PIROE2DRAFT_11013 [Piromyces sp. E2]|nr:hypothetical protein PIROE2DRAFT_11013 [Piromyces sp. E2]|eukprot:OUM62638.1 hypothetical protein PIROE2DRAFT_11013 [Piromyces sp. E2]